MTIAYEAAHPLGINNPPTSVGHNRPVIIHADSRLAALAIAKLAAIGALIGLPLGIVATTSGESPALLLIAPIMLGLLSGATLGMAFALTWWLFAGHVTYAVENGQLTGRRGRWVRTEVPVERVAEVSFDRQVRWTTLVFTGWLAYESPIPALSVRLTASDDRWDPSSAATVDFPKLLISGERQTQAIAHLRQAIGASPGD